MNNQITQILFKDIVYIIEKGKQQAVAQVNSMLTLTYWHIGNKINDHILKMNELSMEKRLSRILHQH